MIRSLFILAALLLAGCVPYPVGHTAQPVEPGRWHAASMAYAIPDGVRPDWGGEEAPREGASFVGADVEYRTGLDDASDLGVRVPGGAGVVVTYKRRVSGTPDGPALALMGGGGFINLANHAHFEVTALASGREAGVLTPYGGLRAMQAVPLSASAPSDAPTLGAFAGMMLRPEAARRRPDGPAVALEVGLYYDPSATGIRQADWIVVPSLTLHGRLPFQRLAL